MSSVKSFLTSNNTSDLDIDNNDPPLTESSKTSDSDSFTSLSSASSLLSKDNISLSSIEDDIEKKKIPRIKKENDKIIEFIKNLKLKGKDEKLIKVVKECIITWIKDEEDINKDICLKNIKRRNDLNNIYIENLFKSKLTKKQLKRIYKSNCPTEKKPSSKKTTPTVCSVSSSCIFETLSSENINLNNEDLNFINKHATNTVLSITKDIEMVNYLRLNEFYSKNIDESSFEEDLDFFCNIISNILYNNNKSIFNFEENSFMLGYLLPLISDERFFNEKFKKDLYNIIISLKNTLKDKTLAFDYFSDIYLFKEKHKDFKCTKEFFLKDLGLIYNNNNNNVCFQDFIESMEDNFFIRIFFSNIFLQYIPKYIIEEKCNLTNDQFIFSFISFRNVFKTIFHKVYEKFGNKLNFSENFIWSSVHEKNNLLFFMEKLLKDNKLFINIYKNKNEKLLEFYFPKKNKKIITKLFKESEIEESENFVYTTITTLGDYSENDEPKYFRNFFKNWYSICLSNLLVEFKEINLSKKNLDNNSVKIFSNFFTRLLWRNCISCEKDSSSSSNSGITNNNLEWYIFNEKSYLKQESEYAIIDHIKKYLKLLENFSTKISEDLKPIKLKCKKKLTTNEIVFLNEEIKNKNYLQVCINDFISRFNSRNAILLKEILFHIGSSKLIRIENFNRYKNKNPCIMAFENCVLEVNDVEAIKRKGKIEDYLTKSTRIDLRYNKKEVEKAYDYLNKVFPDINIYEYALNYFSSFYYGKNCEKFIAVFTGKRGNNSKSIIVKIFGKIMGDLKVDFNSSELCTSNKNKDGSGPSPALADAEDTRIAIVIEPPSSFKIDGGMMKKHTGGDDIRNRRLFENGKSMQLTYKLILCCNDPPEIEGFDNAIKNRVVMIPFESTWSNNAPVSQKEQFKQKLFPIDENFEKNIPSIAHGLAWIMFENYKNYKKNKILDFPEKIKKINDEYWNDVNIFLNFYNEKIEKEDIDNNINPKYFLTPKEGYLEFCNFWSTVNSQTRVKYNLKKFKDSLTPILGDIKKISNLEKEGIIKNHKELQAKLESVDCWVGFRIKPTNTVKFNDEEDSD